MYVCVRERGARAHLYATLAARDITSTSNARIHTSAGAGVGVGGVWAGAGFSAVRSALMPLTARMQAT